jgi:hypothetical protein
LPSLLYMRVLRVSLRNKRPFLTDMSYSHMPYDSAHAVAVRFAGPRCYTKTDGVHIVMISCSMINPIASILIILFVQKRCWYRKSRKNRVFVQSRSNLCRLGKHCGRIEPLHQSKPANASSVARQSGLVAKLVRWTLRVPASVAPLTYCRLLGQNVRLRHAAEAASPCQKRLVAYSLMMNGRW